MIIYLFILRRLILINLSDDSSINFYAGIVMPEAVAWTVLNTLGKSGS